MNAINAAVKIRWLMQPVFFQICRLVSLNLRAGVKVEEVIKQIKGIRGPDPSWSNGKPMFSIADAIAQTMEQHIAAKAAARGKVELPLGQEKIEATTAETLPNLIQNLNVKVKENISVSDESKISIANFGSAPICPDCANTLTMAEGCMKCLNCGFSKC